MSVKSKKQAGLRARVGAHFVKAKTRLGQYVRIRPYRSFKVGGRKVKPAGLPLPTFRRQLGATWAVIKSEKKNLLILGLLYAALSYVASGGLSQGDFLNLKEATVQIASGDLGVVETALSLFSGMVPGLLASAGTELQQFLAALMFFIFWLAVVWLVRMRTAGNNVKVRDALYNCCAPLIPSFLVLVAIAAQTLPASLGIFAFNIGVSNGYLQGGVETMLFVVASALLCLLSSYWVSASLIALVIVSLPQTRPWHALAAASQLVIGQRLKLMLHAVVLTIVIFLLWVVVLVPSLLLDGWLRWDWLPILPVMVQLLGAASLVYCSVYIYKLYRSLL